VLPELAVVDKLNAFNSKLIKINLDKNAQYECCLESLKIVIKEYDILLFL